MTNQAFQVLPAAKRRRLIFSAVLRGVLVAAVLLVLYYVLPLNGRWDSEAAIRLLVGVLVFAGVMVWEVRVIAGSRYPGLRAAEALGLILPLYLVLFASAYFVDGACPCGELHRAADPRGRFVLHGDRVLYGGFRGYYRQIRDRPGGAHRANAR